MFFVGIFGINSKEEHLKDISSKICKNCGMLTTYKLYKTYSYFHIFFIKLFKFNEEYFVISRCCSKIYQIPKHIGFKLETGEINEINDSDMIEIKNPYTNEICPNCNNYINPNFSYCPYCGTKLN